MAIERNRSPIVYRTYFFLDTISIDSSVVSLPVTICLTIGNISHDKWLKRPFHTYMHTNGHTGGRTTINTGRTPVAGVLCHACVNSVFVLGCVKLSLTSNIQCKQVFIGVKNLE